VPEVDERIMEFVEGVLQKSPDIELADLYERARAAIPSVEKLTKRQFNARYPLQVKRRRALASRTGGRKRGKAAPRVRTESTTPLTYPMDQRSHVRQVLLQFAIDVAAAEDRKALVEILARVDQYVGRILEPGAGS